MILSWCHLPALRLMTPEKNDFLGQEKKHPPHQRCFSWTSLLESHRPHFSFQEVVAVCRTGSASWKYFEFAFFAFGREIDTRPDFPDLAAEVVDTIFQNCWKFKTWLVSCSLILSRYLLVPTGVGHSAWRRTTWNGHLHYGEQLPVGRWALSTHCQAPLIP